MKVLISNTYRGNRRLAAYRRKVRRINPHVLLACEANNLGGIGGYRRLGAPAWMPREARAVAVYVRSGIEVHGFGVVRLARAVPGVLYAEDRYAAWARIRQGGRCWLVVSVHLNPGRDTLSSLQNARYVRGVAALVADAGGYTPIIGGDWNRRTDESAKNGTPHHLARLAPPKLVVRLSGIDGIVLPTGRVRSIRRRRMPGSDHWGLVAKVAAD